MLAYIFKSDLDRTIIQFLKEGVSIKNIAEGLDMDMTKVLERCRTIQFELVEARKLISRDDYLSSLEPNDYDDSWEKGK